MNLSSSISWSSLGRLSNPPTCPLCALAIFNFKPWRNATDLSKLILSIPSTQRLTYKGRRDESLFKDDKNN